MWRVLRPVIGRKQQQCTVPNISPDALNEYYATIGQTTADSVPAPSVDVPTLLPRVLTCSFKVQPIDLDTLCINLATMRSSKSTGVDGISIHLLQKFFFGLGFPLLDVINSSLISASVPAPWKHALVTPIPKGRTAAGPADTRPISILPAITKLVERIVQKQLSEYLENHRLISDAQHGYRKQHSTETALNVITDTALQAMDRGEISILVLLDFSKCFDVVPHKNLLQKLALYGIDTRWFSSYLAGHTQQVQVRAVDGSPPRARPGGCDCVLSKTCNMPMGIFQGGALSCTLFSLYANDLSMCVNSDVTIVQYCDDTQIMVTGKKRELPQLIDRLEAALKSVYQWCCLNKMKLNTKKTQMIVLGTRAMLRDLPPVSLNFCGAVVQETRAVKNLGVVIDRHLNYESHIDSVTRKCTGILVALSHTRHVIPRSALKCVVQALVLSVVNYCASVYGTCGATQMHRVQKIVNFCARVVTGRSRRDHIADALSQLGWYTAQQLVAYQTVCAVRRILLTSAPPQLLATIGPRATTIHDHNTRRANLFTVPQIRTEAGRRRLNYRGVLLLNSSGLDPIDPLFCKLFRQMILTGTGINGEV